MDCLKDTSHYHGRCMFTLCCNDADARDCPTCLGPMNTSFWLARLQSHGLTVPECRAGILFNHALAFGVLLQYGVFRDGNGVLCAFDFGRDFLVRLCGVLCMLLYGDAYVFQDVPGLKWCGRRYHDRGRHTCVLGRWAQFHCASVIFIWFHGVVGECLESNEIVSHGVVGMSVEWGVMRYHGTCGRIIQCWCNFAVSGSGRGPARPFGSMENEDQQQRATPYGPTIEHGVDDETGFRHRVQNIHIIDGMLQMHRREREQNVHRELLGRWRPHNAGHDERDDMMRALHDRLATVISDGDDYNTSDGSTHRDEGEREEAEHWIDLNEAIRHMQDRLNDGDNDYEHGASRERDVTGGENARANREGEDQGNRVGQTDTGDDPDWLDPNIRDALARLHANMRELTQQVVGHADPHEVHALAHDGDSHSAW
eukprot:6492106-Amphidinium_carterae.1